MIRFLVRRALRGLLVIWLITLVVFGMFFVAPSNVAQTLGGRQATPETIALINQRLGLDRPIWQQYLSFLGNALRGDLGYDYYKQIPVTTIIADALPKTVSIAFGAAVIWILLGVTNGVLSAVRPRSFLDRGLTVFALVFYSMPTFLLGLLLLYYLYFQLTLAGIRIFPAGGYVEPHDEPGRLAAAHDPAVDHRGVGLRGGLHAAHPHIDAGGARRGLHPHRPVQGDLGAPRRRAPRAAQRAHAGGHPVRHRRRLRCSAA